MSGCSLFWFVQGSFGFSSDLLILGILMIRYRSDGVAIDVVGLLKN